MGRAVADLRLTVALAATDKLSAPLRKLTEVSGKLGKAFAAASADLKKFQAQQALVGRARDAQKSLADLSARLQQAQQRQQSWAAALKAGGNAAKLARPEFKKASDDVQRLTASYQRQIDQSKKLRAALTANGLGKLTADEDRLRAAIDKASQAMTRQQARMEKLDAARQRRDRAVTLGGALAGYGYGAYHGGTRAAGGLLHMLEPGKQGQIEEARVRALGMDPAHTAQAIDAAKRLRVAGSSMVDNIGLTGDAMSAFADTEHAQMVVPTLAKMKAANAVLFPEDGGERDKQLLDMLKVVELRGGLKSEAEFKVQADMVQQVLTATRGRVAPHEWRSLIARGGVAAKSMDAGAFFYDLEPLVQDMGGAAVGAGLTAGYNGLYQGRTTKRAANLMDELGLIADKSKVSEDKAGQIKFLSPGALKGADLFAQNQFKWMEDVLLPTLAKQGITEKQKVLDVIGGIYSNPRGGNLMAQMYLQREQIHRAAARNAGADGIDAAHSKAMGSAGGGELQLSKRRDDLYMQMGNAVLPAYVKLLEVLTKVVTKVSAFAQAHPTFAKWLLIGAAGITALAVAAGAVLIPLGLMIGQFALLRFGLTFLGGGGMLGRVLSLLRIVGPVAGAAGGGLGILGRMGGWLARAWGVVWPVMSRFGFVLQWVWRIFAMTPWGRAIAIIIAAGVLIYKNWDRISGWLKTAWGAIVRAWDWFMGALRAGWDAFAGFIGPIAARLVNFYAGIGSTIVSGFQGFLSGISGIIGAISDVLGPLLKGDLGGALEAIKALPDKFFQAGSDIVMGWVNGLKSAFPAAYEAISNMSSSVIGWFKEKLGIASPSRVFMQLGSFIGEGAAQGIEQGQPRVSRAALALAASAAAITAPVAMAGQFSPAAAAGFSRPAASAPVSMAGSRYSITINAAPGMDPQAIAQAVRQELDKRDRAQRSRVNSQLSDME